MIDISKEIFSKYPKLKNNKIVKGALNKFASSVIHQENINLFLNKNAHLIGFEFVDAVLDYFNFDFTTADKSIENIPESGRLIIISNHPLGSLDALVLLKLISKVRKDVKIVANDFLNSFDALKPLLIPINNFKNRQSKDSIQNIYNALDNEQALIIFPAGEVSRMTSKGVKDGAWKKSFLKFATKTSSPILPILVDAKNSKTFYSVSAINKKLSTLLLADEMYKQKGNTVNIYISGLIPSKNIKPDALETQSIVDLYKKQVYGLKKGKQFFITQKAIAHPQDRRLIKKELRSSQLLGKTKDNKLIYLYENTKESIVLNELGRLRELAFRKVGEGVNKRLDLDKYDKYYKHIILWDEEELEIVGAYRVGECKSILKKYGKDALYNSTLFNFSRIFEERLEFSIELGRSFVQPKYWGTRALDYLWYGIGAYLNKNKHIKYLYGPVSLSATYPRIAKDILFSFYDMYFHSKQELVKAKNSYNFKNDKILQDILNIELIKDNYKADFKTVKKLLKTFDVTIPTLYKQYSELCEDGGVEFCAYNIDEEFSSCVDSLIIVEIDKIKQVQKDRYFNSHN